MKSELPALLAFKENDIDWLKCYEYACNSLVKRVCYLWNKSKNKHEISRELKINPDTVVNYLKMGAKIGWCNYDPKEESENNYVYLSEIISKKVICLTTNEVFNSITEASLKYNVSHRTISACCSNYKSYIKTAGTHHETNEKLVWMFHEDFINKTENEIEEFINNALTNKKHKKVICLTTGEIFETLNKAAKHFHINPSHISECCKGIIKTSGKLPDGTKLKWAFCETEV